MRKNFGIVALIFMSAWSFDAKSGTTQCSNAEQTIKYVYDAPDGGAPRRSLVELTVYSKVVYKTTLNGTNEINDADYSFDDVMQKEIASSVNNERKERTSLYWVNLVVKLRKDAKNYSDFLICNDTRTTIPRP